MCSIYLLELHNPFRPEEGALNKLHFSWTGCADAHWQGQIQRGCSNLAANPCWTGPHHEHLWGLFKVPKVHKNLPFPSLFPTPAPATWSVHTGGWEVEILGGDSAASAVPVASPAPCFAKSWICPCPLMLGTYHIQVNSPLKLTGVSDVGKLTFLHWNRDREEYQSTPPACLWLPKWLWLVSCPAKGTECCASPLAAIAIGWAL